MTQPELMPQKPPIYDNLSVRLDQLPPDHLLEGPDPDHDLIDSVRTFGVIDPLTVLPVTIEAGSPAYPDGYEYIVLDGGRRVKALRHLLREWQTDRDSRAQEEPLVAMERPPEYLAVIPARVPRVEEGDPADTLALHKHATRKRNPISEYQRIKRLLRTNNVHDVARRTGLTVGEIKRLLKLDAMPINLLEGASQGRVSMGQCYAIVALPEAARERLDEAFVAGGSKGIKTSDIEAERHVRVEAATTTFDWTTIGAVPALETPATTPEPDRASVESLDLGRAIYAALRQMIDLGESTGRGTVSYDGREYDFVLSPAGEQVLPAVEPAETVTTRMAEVMDEWLKAPPINSTTAVTHSLSLAADQPTYTAADGITYVNIVTDERLPVDVVAAVRLDDLNQSPPAEAWAGADRVAIVTVTDDAGAVDDGGKTVCQHGVDVETCQDNPCKRKRQQRDFARRARAAKRQAAD